MKTGRTRCIKSATCSSTTPSSSVIRRSRSSSTHGAAARRYPLRSSRRAHLDPAHGRHRHDQTARRPRFHTLKLEPNSPRHILHRNARTCAQPHEESSRFRVLGHVADLRIDSWTECWVPSPECVLPLFVEYAGSDLKQKVSSALAPGHLLAFYHPFADDLIDC